MDHHRSSFPPTSGRNQFQFIQPNGQVNWKRVHKTNVEFIAKTENVEDAENQLGDFLEDMLYGEVNAKDTPADPALVKAFNTAQYSAQYLAHCQEKLEEYNGNVEDRVAESCASLQQLHDRFVRRRNEKCRLRKQISEIDETIGRLRDTLLSISPHLASHVEAIEGSSPREFLKQYSQSQSSNQSNNQQYSQSSNQSNNQQYSQSSNQSNNQQYSQSQSSNQSNNQLVATSVEHDRVEGADAKQCTTKDIQSKLVLVKNARNRKSSRKSTATSNKDLEQNRQIVADVQDELDKLVLQNDFEQQNSTDSVRPKHATMAQNCNESVSETSNVLPYDQDVETQHNGLSATQSNSFSTTVNVTAESLDSDSVVHSLNVDDEAMDPSETLQTLEADSLDWNDTTRGRTDTVEFTKSHSDCDSMHFHEVASKEHTKDDEQTIEIDAVQSENEMRPVEGSRTGASSLGFSMDDADDDDSVLMGTMNTMGQNLMKEIAAISSNSRYSEDSLVSDTAGGRSGTQPIFVMNANQSNDDVDSKSASNYTDTGTAQTSQMPLSSSNLLRRAFGVFDGDDDDDDSVLIGTMTKLGAGKLVSAAQQIHSSSTTDDDTATAHETLQMKSAIQNATGQHEVQTSAVTQFSKDSLVSEAIIGSQDVKDFNNKNKKESAVDVSAIACASEQAGLPFMGISDNLSADQVIIVSLDRMAFLKSWNPSSDERLASFQPSDISLVLRLGVYCIGYDGNTETFGGVVAAMLPNNVACFGSLLNLDKFISFPLSRQTKLLSLLQDAIAGEDHAEDLGLYFELVATIPSKTVVLAESKVSLINEILDTGRDLVHYKTPLLDVNHHTTGDGDDNLWLAEILITVTGYQALSIQSGIGLDTSETYDQQWTGSPGSDLLSLSESGSMDSSFDRMGRYEQDDVMHR